MLSKEKKWKRGTNEYVTYHNTMSALTAIITDYCPEIFYKVLHHPDLGYENRTPHEFVVHFWNTYAMGEDPDMSKKLDCMILQWQPPTMLEVLFTKLDVGQKFAAYHDAISEKLSFGWQLIIFVSLVCWTSISETGSYRQPNLIGQTSPSSCKRQRNTGMTRQHQSYLLDSPLTSTASHRNTSLFLLHWPPRPHRIFLNWRVIYLWPPMLKPPKSQL